MAIEYLEGKGWDNHAHEQWVGGGRTGQPRTRKTYDNHESSMPFEECKRLVQAGVSLLLSNRKTISSGGSEYKELQGVLAELDKAKDRTVIITLFKGIHQFSQMPHLTARIIGERTLHVWLSLDAVSVVPGKSMYTAKTVSATESGPFVPACTVVRIPPPGRKRGNSISLADVQVVLENQRAQAEQERLQKLEMENQEATNYLNAMAAAHGLPLPDYEV